jgi:hypothetical protein
LVIHSLFKSLDLNFFILGVALKVSTCPTLFQGEKGGGRQFVPRGEKPMKRVLVVAAGVALAVAFFTARAAPPDIPVISVSTLQGGSGPLVGLEEKASAIGAGTSKTSIRAVPKLRAHPAVFRVPIGNPSLMHVKVDEGWDPIFAATEAPTGASPPPQWDGRTRIAGNIASPGPGA